MSNPSLIKNFSAGAAISAYRQVKFSAAETVIQGAAATDATIGVANEVGAASGERQDVVLDGIAYVEAGAAVTIGTLITSDATGRAVTAAPAAGTNNRIVGIALDAATAAGDVIRVLLAPGSVQG
ncbi:MAG: capsid cement protein [Candidatus Accumulibacter phosphatis]